jgi:hypothetical protein
MGKRLPVPPELEFLIEKRENDNDRREREERGGDRRGDDDLGPLGAIESTRELRDLPTEERRTNEQRRKKKDRRRKSRRKDGAS